jgi:plasmid stabilization system protein ParE
VNVIYRPQFWLDLEDGVAYLARKASPEVARRWHEEAMASVARVKKQPDIGRPRRDLTIPGIRSLTFRRYPRYMLFYKWEGDVVEVLRVKHGMMFLPALFDPTQTPPADD